MALILTSLDNSKHCPQLTANGQGFMLCWYSLNVQPGTAAWPFDKVKY
jgi:hypothetical protein